eukprot:scaffold32288_cov18-Prasinocladus_malaysianus.AAC.1
MSTAPASPGSLQSCMAQLQIGFQANVNSEFAFVFVHPQDKKLRMAGWFALKLPNSRALHAARLHDMLLLHQKCLENSIYPVSFDMFTSQGCCLDTYGHQTGWLTPRCPYMYPFV